MAQSLEAKIVVLGSQGVGKTRCVFVQPWLYQAQFSVISRIMVTRMWES